VDKLTVPFYIIKVKYQPWYLYRYCSIHGWDEIIYQDFYVLKASSACGYYD